MRILVTGCMRSGTTLLARWLAEALPGSVTRLRETGITLTVHQLLTVLEYNQRSHEFGFSIPPGSALRREMLQGVAGVAAGLYRDRGHAPGRHLLDKQPYALGDAPAYYDHLYELFPEIKIIATVRAPEPTVASMLRRTWGRGPWPRPALISPVTPYLTDAENTPGDLAPDGGPAPEGPVTDARRWSLAKACLHYNRAVEGLAESSVANRGLVLDYDGLGNPATRSAVERFLGVRLLQDVTFQPTGIPPAFTAEDRAFVRRETRGARAAFERLAGLTCAS